MVVAELVFEPTIFLDGSERLRTVWRFLIFGLSSFLVQIVVGLVLGVILFVGLTVSGGPHRFDDPLQLERDVESAIEEWMPLLLAIVALPLTGTMFGLVFVCRKYLDRRSISSMGFVRRRLGASVVAGILAGVIPIATAVVVIALAGGVNLDGVGFSIMAVIMIPTLVLMAFMEEIVFRSYLLQNLLDIQRPVFGVVFTSFVFWMLHALNPHVWSSALIPLNMFGAGVVLALAYMVSKNIWFVSAVHFGWNVAQGPSLSLPVSGLTMDGFVRLRAVENAPTWLTGGDFGLEASAIVTVIELVSITALLWLLRSRRVSSR